ncbi:isoprenyl transferase [Oceanibaculum pacificum]|uniref:Isoprenyl transferase n=1 Tax=Oceanibaculum pacificum TaxID=580166 RepID=A0A154W0Y6_9PROT|nr:isoprenyl transferase [Oceanibaculum pacificum]KZD07186.1 UDP pyrophosphate synthase [Oceanibaculum pacificum]
MAVVEKTQAPQPPAHVAIIMDGNGRWAMARGLPRAAGHRQGAEAVRRAVRSAAELGVGYLTLFGFSSENWRRPLSEVDDLMGLLRFYLRREIAELHANNVRLRVIGDRGKLPADIVALIENAEALTAGNGGLSLIIALSYGSRQEIAEAMRRIAQKVAAGDLAPAQIDEELVGAHLQTADIPDPDLIVRTSGEKRISNFLLWQAAYAEFVFLDTLWPDFAHEHFEEAIREFHRRERRYGAAVG